MLASRHGRVALTCGDELERNLDGAARRLWRRDRCGRPHPADAPAARAGGGHWGLAGGKIDLFETAEQAMRREVAEELGIVVDEAVLLCFVDQIDRDRGTHWVAPVFVVRSFRGEPRNCEPEKHEGPAWFALDALPAPLTTPTIAAIAALTAGEVLS
ncbi:MAG: NUDIX domain-containing protein [Sphingomonas sp.]